MAFVAPVVEQWVEQERTQLGPSGGIDLTTYHTTSSASTTELHLAP